MSFILIVTMQENLLPSLFAVENYTVCLKNENNTYCNVMINLAFSLNNHSLMDYVNTIVKNKDNYDRRVIHRNICLPKNKFENFNSSFCQEYLDTNDLNTLGISDTEIVSCIDKYQSITYYDISVILLVFGYLCFVGYATYVERTSSNNENLITGFLNHFSLYKNWKERISLSKNDDFQNLLSIQSLRFFLMLIIILLHVLILNILVFKSNPLEFEKIFKDYYKTNFFIFMVLPFFMFSSWLLVVQTYNHVKKPVHMSLKDIGIMLLNRYLRLIVTIVILLLLMITTLTKLFAGPLSFTFINLNTAACYKNWYKSLFFISNFDATLQVCNGVTWYVSTDWQLYVINLLGLYIKLRFKIKEVIFYPILLLGACIMHGLSIYFYGNGSDIVFTLNIRNFEERNFRLSTETVVYYTSTLSNWPCSIIGLILGDIYYKNKNKKIENQRVMVLVLLILFIGCPTGAVFLSYIKTSSATGAVLGSILKPLFNFGIGVGILGLALNVGGIIKKIVEFKFFVVMGNFTYCVYLIHLMCLTLFHSIRGWPSNISHLQIVLPFIFGSLLSWLLGILLTCIVEEPGLQLQKRFLPQIKKYPTK